MGASFKRTRLGTFGIVPEIVQGTRNYKLEATGGSVLKTTVEITDTAATGFDNANLTSCPADFFNGLEVYWITGNNAGSIYGITGTAYGAGTPNTVTLTVDTMGTAAAAGEDFYILGRLPASNVSWTVGTENLTREDFVRETLDRPSSLKGLQVCNGSFDCELLGRANTADASDAASVKMDQVSNFLRGVGARSTTQGGATVSSGSGASIVVSSASGISAGSYILVLGEVAKVTVQAGTTLTLSPALTNSAADLASEIVYGSEYFTPADSGHQSYTIVNMLDDQLWEFYGCVYTVSMSGEFGQNTSMAVEWTGENYSVETSDVTAFSFNNITTKTIPFITGRAVSTISGSDTTNNLGSFEFALGHGIELVRDTGEHQKAIITTREATIGFALRDLTEPTIKDQSTGVEAKGTLFNTLIQVGNTTQNAAAVYGQAQYQDPSSNPGDRAGIAYWDLSAAYVDDSTDVSDPKKPIIIRF